MTDRELAAGKDKLMKANGRLSWIVAAEACFRRHVETRPSDPAGHYWLGLSICYQGRAPDAIAHLGTAIRLNESSLSLTKEESAQAYERLGEGLMLADRLEEAERILAIAANLQPQEVGQRLNSAKYMLDGILRLRKAGTQRRFARWPVKARDLSSLEQLIDHATRGFGISEPLLHRNSRVATLGSCFALNIAHALQRIGLQVYPFGLGELINSTYANRALLEWIATDRIPPFCESSVIDVLRAYFGQTPGETRRRLSESDVVVFTLGVTPGFFDKKTKLFHLTQPGNNTLHLLSEKEFRSTSVAENVANMRRIVELIRVLNPQTRLVFTVSPVPLYSTFEYDSAVVADCVSKSTLRVAIDELLRESILGVHYWPAFEVVRWLGAYHGPMYGAEDGTTRHVSEEVVAAIVKKFVLVHGDDEIRRLIS